MIIQCEQCATRFKVADDKVTATGIKVRCSKCQHVFVARRDDGAVAATSPAATSPAATSPAATASPPPRATGSFDVTVPNASIAMSTPAFNPFEPPPQAAPSSSPSGSAGFALDFGLSEEGQAVGSDRSMFGSSNQTIGGFDPHHDDVPVPPPDPFAAPVASPSSYSGNPFAQPSPPPPSGNLFFTEPAPPPPARAADPFSPATTSPPVHAAFGGEPGPSRGAAFPTGGDPFAATAATDPFAARAPFGAADPFGGGADPFAAATSPPPPAAAAGADPFGGGEDPFAPASTKGPDPFAGLGVDVDPYASAAGGYEEPDAMHAAPTVVATAPAAPPPKREEPVAPPAAPRRRLRIPIPPSVWRAGWAALQAVILVGFVTLALVWVRGGSVDDIVAGRALSVVIGGVLAADAAAPVHVEDLVVTRRPVTAAPDLVVVSGFVVNAGDVDAPAAKVTARVGSVERSAWAGAAVDGVDLASAASGDDIEALAQRLPEVARVKAGGRAPFVVLVRGVADGQKASVSVVVSEPPLPAQLAPVEAPPEPEPKKAQKPANGKKGPAKRVAPPSSTGAPRGAASAKGKPG